MKISKLYSTPGLSPGTSTFENIYDQMISDQIQKYLDQSVDALSPDVAGDVLGARIIGCSEREPGDEVLIDPSIRSRPLRFVLLSF